jgi:putative chitinase
VANRALATLAAGLLTALAVPAPAIADGAVLTIGPRALQKVCPGVGKPTSTARTLGAAMRAYGINNERRASAFIAQTAHESGCYRYRVELWGPTLLQAGYWRRRDLGNSAPAHGFMYRGRGYLQITGRANYTAVSRALRRDFVRYPEKLGTLTYAALSAAWWWRAHGCNALADRRDFTGLTRRINGAATWGPPSHLAMRKQLYARAIPVARYLVPARRVIR